MSRLNVTERIGMEEIDRLSLNKLYTNWEFTQFDKVSKMIMDDVIENDNISFRNAELIREIYEISMLIDRLDHVTGPYFYCMADKAKLDSIIKEVYGEEEFTRITKF